MFFSKQALSSSASSNSGGPVSPNMLKMLCSYFIAAPKYTLGKDTGIKVLKKNKTEFPSIDHEVVLGFLVLYTLTAGGSCFNSLKTSKLCQDKLWQRGVERVYNRLSAEWTRCQQVGSQQLTQRISGLVCLLEREFRRLKLGYKLKY